MSYFDNLPAIARGYRVAGHKLLPRDWEFGARMKMGRIRTVRQLRKEDAIEAAAMGYTVVKNKKRHMKRAEDFYNSDWSNADFKKLPKPVRSILNAVYRADAEYAEREAYGSY